MRRVKPWTKSGSVLALLTCLFTVHSKCDNACCHHSAVSLVTEQGLASFVFGVVLSQLRGLCWVGIGNLHDSHFADDHHDPVLAPYVSLAQYDLYFCSAFCII